MTASPDTPLPIALMRLIGPSRDLAEARAALPPELREAAQQLLTPEAFARVKAVLATVDHTDHAASLESIAAAFDRAASVSPEGGVALYSLGDPALLAQATAEVVDWMAAQGLLGPARRLVEVGCGIGRFLVALSPKVEVALGLEISRVMVAEAGGRCVSLVNALPALGSGRDLACIGNCAVDLLLFADSFPYLVQAGGGLPERHLAEARRVLRPGGRLLILNWSYRGDAGLDESEAAALAGAAGLVSLSFTPPAFRGWDGQPFLFGTSPAA